MGMWEASLVVADCCMFPSIIFFAQSTRVLRCPTRWIGDRRRSLTYCYGSQLEPQYNQSNTQCVHLTCLWSRHHDHHQQKRSKHSNVMHIPRSVGQVFLLLNSLLAVAYSATPSHGLSEATLQSTSHVKQIAIIGKHILLMLFSRVQIWLYSSWWDILNVANTSLIKAPKLSFLTYPCL